MTEIESLELIQELFAKVALEQVRKSHKDQIEDDIDADPFVWELLYIAHNKYLEAISIGKTEVDALCIAKNVFTSKSIAS